MQYLANKSTISNLKRGDINIHRVLQRFGEINSLRLERINKALTKRQQDFLTLLPLIFHSNHELLPGYILDCPAGLPDFRVSAEMQIAAKKHAKSYNSKLKAFRTFDLLAIFLMGSPGTIAYSPKSDFDFWLCYNPNLNQEDKDKLEEKIQILTQWAEEIGLEITIFMVNHKDFRQGKSIPLSVESSGSSQLLLLLEEFYRTAILLVGRYPLWWIVPPEQDANYDEAIKTLDKGAMIKGNMVNKTDYIDFGPLCDIPADEFLGATVWQIYKGIDSPYKSILKLMLMEAYAHEFPNIELLSSTFKKHIYYDEKLELDTIDPYLLLLEKLTNYLTKEHSTERLFLIQRCFYLKVDCNISNTSARSPARWRADLLLDLMTNWRWEEHTHKLLDHKSNWKLNDVITEQSSLVSALTYSYRKLNEFFKRHSHAKSISQRDLNLLGRKLHAAFDRKAGKIEIVNRQYKNQLVEPHISFHQFTNPQDEKGWKLYLGVVTRKEMDYVEALNQSANLMKLLNWLFFNGAANQYTQFLITDYKGYKLDTKEIVMILSDLNTIYPDNVVGKSSLDDLSKPFSVEKSVMFVNVTKDPFENNNSMTQFATNQTDSFRYGASYKNLVLSIDIAYTTTWKEVMYYHFQGDTAIMDCLCQYLRWNDNTSSIQQILPQLVKSYSSPRGTFIAERIQNIISDVVKAFNAIQRQHQRYLLAIGKNYYLIAYKNDEPYYTKLKNLPSLIHELSLPRKYFSTLTVDHGVKENTNLEEIYRRNTVGVIQFFYFAYRDYVDIYILDDLGSLYNIHQPIEEDNVQINHYILFLNTIIQRRLFNPSADLNDHDTNLSLSIYKMNKKDNELVITEQAINSFRLPDQFLNIQAIGHTNQENKSYFSIFCDNHEYSALDHGNNLYHEIAKSVLKNRPSGLKYPIYLTDIDLEQSPNSLTHSPQVQICQLLKYKEQIELKLNTAIQAI